MGVKSRSKSEAGAGEQKISLHNLSAAPGSTKNRKRLGRGPGSGTGKTSGRMGDSEISGKVNGDTLTWSANITQPMPMTLEFEATVDGDAMKGNVKLGAFGITHDTDTLQLIEDTLRGMLAAMRLAVQDKSPDMVNGLRRELGYKEFVP